MDRLAQAERAHKEALIRLAEIAHEMLNEAKAWTAFDVQVIGDELTDILIDLGGEEKE